MKWHVVLSGKPMQFGGFGLVGTSYGATVVAEDRESAVQAARAAAREKMPEYADGRVQSAHVVRTFAFTLRGRHDKRKRETFVASGTSPEDAWRALRFNGPVYKFAGPSIKLDDPTRVIRIKEVTPA